MQSNSEIKSFVKERIKNSEKQFVWGMSAILFIVPMITIFALPVYIAMQLVVIMFMYPYLKMLYNNAKGKTIEMEDCFSFDGIKTFLVSTLFVALHLCSYLFPYILCFVVQLVGMFLEMEIVITIGKALCVVYTIIFLFRALRFILYPFYVCHYGDDDISPQMVVSKCNSLMETDYKELLGFTLSFIGWFLLDILTLNILSFYVFPMYFSCLAVWFHNHEFGRPMKGYYDTLSKDLNSGIDFRQQEMLHQQQQEMKDSRQEAIDNYNRQQAQNIPQYRQNNFYNNPPQQPYPQGQYGQGQPYPNPYYQQGSQQTPYQQQNGNMQQQGGYQQPYNQNQPYGRR